MQRSPRWRRARLAALAAIPLLIASTLTTPSVSADVGDQNGRWDGFWGPWEWKNQPDLTTPVPSPEPLGTYDRKDFDNDGVVNIDDNCLLVPNPDQQPAVAGQSIGPTDLVTYAEQWKAENPNSRFRTDSQLGEACSGYNKNYLRTTKGLIESPDEVKDEIFKYLGQSGPMFGGATDPHAGTPEYPEGPGNWAPSLPMCSSWKKIAELPDWILSGFTQPSGTIFQELSKFLEQPGVSDIADCGTGAVPQAVEDSAMEYWFWAGKRLYTDADGGKISNRFVPFITEAPGSQELIWSGEIGQFFNRLHPGLFPLGTGQAGMGYIYRGKSYVDGNDTILMDWRGPNNYLVGSIWFGPSGWLIYDECRAIQTGVYHCSAVLDLVANEWTGQRMTWNEGWMPWVLKGPPTREEYLQAIRTPF
jgi:hypothetical protein